MTTKPEAKGRLAKLACVLAAVIFATGAGGVSASILTPFVDELGGTAATAGLVAGIYSVVLMVCSSPFIKIAEKIGTKIMFTAGAVLFAAGSFLCSLAKTPNQLVIYRFVQAVGGVYVLNLGSEVPKFFSPERKGLAMALFSVLLGLSGFVFSTASGYIAAAVGYGTALVVAGAFATIPIVVLPIGLLPAPPAADRPEGQGLLAVVKVRNIMIACLSNFLVLLCYMTILSLSPLQALELGFPVERVGLIYGAASIGYALIQLPGGALSDKYGRKWLVVIKCLLPTFALLLMAYLPYMPGVPIVLVTVGLAIFAGLGLGIGTPAVYAIVMDSAPTPADVPAALSILFTFFMAPGVAMPYVGKLIDLYGFRPAFIIVAALGFAGALLSALFLKETLKKER